MLSNKDLQVIASIIKRGNDVEIRQRPRTGEILILEVNKKIRNKQ